MNVSGTATERPGNERVWHRMCLAPLTAAEDSTVVIQSTGWASGKVQVPSRTSGRGRYTRKT